MWRRNKYDALNVGSMIENKCFLEKFARIGRERCLGWRCREIIAPNFVARICDHESTNQSAHAVTDQDDALAIWECAPDPIEILAEERGSVGIRITTRVTEEPKLVALAYYGVVPQRVDHRRPARACFLQAMNKNHRRSSWIVLLQPTKHCCVRIRCWIHDTRQPEPFGAFTRNQECRGSIEISGKRKNLFIQCDSFGV